MATQARYWRRNLAEGRMRDHPRLCILGTVPPRRGTGDVGIEWARTWCDQLL